MIKLESWIYEVFTEYGNVALPSEYNSCIEEVIEQLSDCTGCKIVSKKAKIEVPNEYGSKRFKNSKLANKIKIKAGSYYILQKGVNQ